MYPLVTCDYYKLLKDTNDSYKTGNTEKETNQAKLLTNVVWLGAK